MSSTEALLFYKIFIDVYDKTFSRGSYETIKAYNDYFPAAIVRLSFSLKKSSNDLALNISANSLSV